MTPPRTRKLTTWYLLSGWMYVTVPVNGLRSFFGLSLPEAALFSFFCLDDLRLPECLRDSLYDVSDLHVHISLISIPYLSCIIFRLMIYFCVRVARLLTSSTIFSQPVCVFRS